jgi:hypothetical protein
VETGSAMWPSLQKVPVELPNDWRISCRPSSPRPHQLTFPQRPLGTPRPTGAQDKFGLPAACAG